MDRYTETACDFGDRCVKATAAGVEAFTCQSLSTIASFGAIDNGCSTVSSVEYCVCNTDYCNRPVDVRKFYSLKEYACCCYGG